MLAPVVALRRMLSEIFASSRVAGREQGRTNRRGQDKSRKVRTVGSVRNSAKFRLVAHIAKFSRNLDLSITRYLGSTFDTLRRKR